MSSRKIVPNVKQKTELSCGCACVESVARYWGLDVPQPEPEEYGFAPEDICRELVRLGFRLKMGYFNFEDLEIELFKGRPPIVLTSPDQTEESSHWVVVASTSSRGDKRYVSIMDPAVGRKKRQALEDFESSRAVAGYYKFAIVAFLD